MGEAWMQHLAADLEDGEDHDLQDVCLVSSTSHGSAIAGEHTHDAEAEDTNNHEQHRSDRRENKEVFSDDGLGDDFGTRVPT